MWAWGLGESETEGGGWGGGGETRGQKRTENGDKGQAAVWGTVSRRILRLSQSSLGVEYEERQM